MVTLAPAIDACFASTTRPVIRDVLVWAIPGTANIATTNTSKSLETNMERPPSVWDEDESECETACAGAGRNGKVIYRTRRNTRSVWRQYIPAQFSVKGFYKNDRALTANSSRGTPVDRVSTVTR